MSKPLTLAFKDLRLLVRDFSAMFWVLVFPLFMAMIFGSVFGGSNGPNKIDVALIDQDGSKQSQKLVTKLKESTALNVQAPDLQGGQTLLAAAQNAVRKGDLAAYVLIPKGFGQEVARFQYSAGPAIRIGIDPSRQAEAGMLQGVTSQAAFSLMGDAMNNGFSTDSDLKASLASIKGADMSSDDKAALTHLLTDAQQWQRVSARTGSPQTAGMAFQGPKIENDSMASTSATPASPFEITFPQALLWGLLGVISSFAIGMVKEREQGTLVRLQTSMSMSQVLTGKALACLFACWGEMALLLLVGHLLFHIRLQSPLLLAAAILAGSICVVGIMMLLSVVGRTEQAVAGSSWGVMILFSMFGGGMIPVFMMPGWMQAASNFSPLKWTVLSVEGAIWRNFTPLEMLTPCLILIGIGAVTFLTGVRVLKARA